MSRLELSFRDGRGMKWAAGIVFSAAVLASIIFGLSSCWDNKRTHHTFGVQTHDESLPPAEYEKMGLPSASRPWTAADFETATTKLKELGSKSPTKMPRHASDSPSAAYFSAMTSDHNLDVLGDKNHPLSQRIQTSLHLMQLLERMGQIYIESTTVGDFDSEIIDFWAAEIACGATVSELLKEAGASLTQQESLLVKARLSKPITQLTTCLRDNRHYRAEEKARFVRMIKPTLPRMLAGAFEGEREGLKLQLGNLTETEKRAGLQKAMRELVDALQKAPSQQGP